MQSQIRLTLRPNNQITLTKGRWNKKLESVHQSYKPKELIYSDSCPIDYKKNLEMGRDEIAGKRLYHEAMRPHWQEKIATLDITKKSQRSRKAPCMRLNTPKNFTRQSGQKLRESGAAISIACDGTPSKAHEVTLTLPANYTEAFTALAAYSGYAVNRLFQPIRRDYGSDCLWFFVWEYQRRGALHMHICIFHEDENEGQKICARLIDQWHKILCDISEMSGFCLFTAKQKDRCTIRSKHQHHTSPIKKDVGRYFAKYAGKEESKQNWYCQKYPVSRFWGSSKMVKEIIKKNSFQFDFDYQGNENEAIEKYQELIDRIISNLSIVSYSEYSFLIASDRKASLRFYPKNRKILSICNGKVFAEGDRSIFYFAQAELKKAIELLKENCTWF